MALYGECVALTFKAAFPGALASAAYRLLRITGSDVVMKGPLVDVASGGHTQLLIGALRENVHAKAERVPCIVLGECKLAAGAAVAANTMVTADNEGRAIQCTSGSFAIGMALEASSVANEVIRVFVKSPPHRITY